MATLHADFHTLITVSPLCPDQPGRCKAIKQEPTDISTKSKVNSEAIFDPGLVASLPAGEHIVFYYKTFVQCKVVRSQAASLCILVE